MKRVLVPLDMTEAGEEIFPLMAMLARGDATVRLTHVAPAPESLIDPSGKTLIYASQESASMEGVWADYVHSVKARLGIDVEDALRFGDPATEILAEAEASNADTIALSTTATCGVTRALLGGIAKAILRRADISVLLYRPAHAA